MHRNTELSGGTSERDSWFGWGVVAAAALVWPSHAIGALDGAPLDTGLKAISIGLAFPALWWCFPEGSRSVVTRALIILLVAIKMLSTVALTPQGWCVTFVTSRPLMPETSPTQLSWDARADWGSATPRCSAIAARPYPDLASFPAWFLNLADNPGRPPDAIVAMTVDGFVSTPTAGVLSLGLPPGHPIRGFIGDQSIDPRAASATVSAGRHRIHFETTLTGDIWRFEPRWNESGVFRTILTTTAEPRRRDELLGRFAGLATTAIAAGLLASWLFAAWRTTAPPLRVALWVTGAAALCATSGVVFGRTLGSRVAALLLTAALVVRPPPRLQNMRGAVLLIGVPWLALFAGASTWDTGRFSFYTPGDDFWAFQVFAHRIYVQGYWLEGGQTTFWFQPLYRWIVGLVHIVFGDSSVGETYVDAGALLVAALFAFAVVLEMASFLWALAAASLTLATVAMGPSWWLIGRGLSEILAGGLMSGAALVIMSDRGWRTTRLIAVSLLAVASLYLRLNNLICIAALPAFMAPGQLPASAIWTPRRWLPSIRLTGVALVWGALAGGLLLLAWRTWYYTGVFSAFYGTQRDLLATVKPTDSLATALANVVQSVLVVVTVQDPPRFDPRAVLVVAGVTVSLLALLRVPRFREVPAAAAIWCAAGLSGAAITRGSAYVGRFSIHLVPVAVALAISFGAIMWRRVAASDTPGLPAST